MADTLVFICAYNEEESIGAVIEDVHHWLPDADVLVINDGSQDKTAARAREAGAEIISFPENRGVGAAICEGYRAALDRGYEICGRLDGDGQHRAEDLRHLFEKVKDGSCDVAIGSRFLGQSNSYRPSPERVVGTSILRHLISIRLGQPISDSTSGMYCVNRYAMRLLAIPYDVGSPEVQGLLRLSDAELTILEVPAAMREREHGQSSFVGRRAVHLVVTVAGALLVGEAVRRRRRAR